jgi:IS4 transposase
VAELYRGRWTIETAFQELARDLNSEINALGYPKAALFGFCVALVLYNAVALMRAALRGVHALSLSMMMCRITTSLPIWKRPPAA